MLGVPIRVVQLQIAYFYSTLFSIKLYQYFGAQISLVPGVKYSYYMTSSASGQDEPNRVL